MPQWSQVQAMPRKRQSEYEKFTFDPTCYSRSQGSLACEYDQRGGTARQAGDPRVTLSTVGAIRTYFRGKERIPQTLTGGSPTL